MRVLYLECGHAQPEGEDAHTGYPRDYAVTCRRGCGNAAVGEVRDVVGLWSPTTDGLWQYETEVDAELVTIDNDLP